MARTASSTADPSDTLDQRQLLSALRAARNGDFAVRLPLDQTGIAGEIAEAFNGIVELNARTSDELRPVATGAAALEALAQERYDCVVLDPGLPDVTGVELIERIRDATADAPVPVVIYTGKELTQREQSQPRKLPRRSSSRMSGRRSACSTRRPCSCTMSNRNYQNRSAGCSTSYTARTRS